MAKKKTITSSKDVVSIPESDDEVRRWVPCAERLPEADTYTNIALWDKEDDCIRHGQLKSYINADGENESLLWIDTRFDSVMHDISHWLEIGPPDDEDNV